MTSDMNCTGYEHCNIQGFALLKELSLNLRWSWDRRSAIIWEKLDPKLWAITGNPWAVFQAASREKLEKLLADPEIHKLVRELVEANREEESLPGWFQEVHGKKALSSVAYFSMEFMLAEALPIYSGGLGNVAGDLLKAGSDLGVPVIGIGLLYQQGYFRQVLDSEGAQQALYPYNDPGQLPIMPLRKPDGEWLRLEVSLPGYSVWLRAWQVKVGRVQLFLLDSNDPANFPAYRGITSELYGGDSELRLRQEMILGVGGWHLLEALNIEPTVCHLNEGHAAFLVLARASSYMKAHQVDFDTAFKITRAGNLFTTHTAVSAGFDRFSPQLMQKYLSRYCQQFLNIPLKQLLALGRAHVDDDNEFFNMAFLALRGSAFSNGVSALHAKVSRHLFAPLFPRWLEEEIPIGHVTNGIHVPSWSSPASDHVWGGSCGKNRWLQDTKTLGEKINAVSDEELWAMRTSERQELVSFARKRLTLQQAVAGTPPEEIEYAKNIFNPDVLTLGFARRFATYKRPNLLLHDPERFISILKNAKCPVQLILAGKAHPADRLGQALIQEWSNFIKRPEVRAHVIYLSDYNMLLCEQLVQGVDVWINTPLRPWEACGTSGMKILANGGLNLSVPDGWWAEAYSPDIGWAIGCGQDESEGSAEAQARDAADADALYTLLEKEVIPLFYQNNAKGIPEAWIARMRASMAKLTPHYSSNRMMREYTEKYYLPAAELYQSRVDLSVKYNWPQLAEQQWKRLQFGPMRVETVKDVHRFIVELALNGVDPTLVKVELFANGGGDSLPLCYAMQNVQQAKENSFSRMYSVEVPALHPADYYTPRAMPCSSNANTTALELPYILWQH